MELAMTQFRMLLPVELSPALLQNSVAADELNSRIKASTYAILSGQESLVTQRDARLIIERIHSQEKVSRDVTQLRGTCAVAGKVRGIVTIINSTREMPKMQEGQILVSYVTDVNLEAAMMKAGAIVTDSGGMTSHAAIFAREFGITCLVGTKVATKVLADGDEVEVDAEIGIVRILNRAHVTS
jgi:pyruvate,water dikinase